MTASTTPTCSLLADSLLWWPCRGICTVLLLITLSIVIFSSNQRNLGLLRMQVSHHPPIGVGHGENDNWTYDIVSAPSTKFLGNSVEIYPIGVPTLVLEGSSCWKAAALFRHVVNH